MADEIKPEDWQQAEENVNEAERIARGAFRASRVVYQKSGILRIKRGEDFQTRITQLPNKRTIAIALAHERVLGEQADNLLGPANSPEKALVYLRRENLKQALRDARDIENRSTQLSAEEASILSSVSGEPAGVEQEALEEIRKELAGENRKMEQLLQSSPEAFYLLHLKQLKEFKRALQLGRIVKTKYVKEIFRDAKVHYLAGQPILLYGHLGSGKTEAAMLLAEELVGRSALIISGRQSIASAEVYGHQVLTLDKKTMEDLREFAGQVEQEYQKWVQEHNNIFRKNKNSQSWEAEKNRAHQRILEIMISQLKSGTISRFFLGPIYQAMDQGIPMIIDEIDGIPHEFLISLNHILTRKVGDMINVQQDSGRFIRIKRGYGVITTANLHQNQQVYVARQDMDPAFMSRLYKIQYGYLPQETEGTLEEQAGEKNELFAVMLAKIMDKNGNIEAPQDSIRKLWNLAKAARIIQNVFEDKEVDQAFYFQIGGGKAVKILKESVLSLRAIDAILTQWQKEGYRYELDYYIWKEFASQSTQASDRAYLYQLLKDRFGFFKSDGWEQSPNYGTGGIINSFEITAPQNPSTPRKFFGPREVIEYAFGKAPERARWPEIPIQEEEEIIAPDVQRKLDWRDDMTESLEEVYREIDLRYGST